MIKHFLFDLDATLLQMDQEEFIHTYLPLLAKKAYITYGIDPKEFIKNLWTATYKIIENDGSITNLEAFNECFFKIYPQINEEFFISFYENEFKQVESIVTKQPYSNLIIKELKRKGYDVVLATTPVFPRIATLTRMSWCNLDPNDFKDITTYETSHFAKPSKGYFEEILKRNNFKEEETVLVGNDMKDDFSSYPKKMDAILIVDHMLNVTNLEEIKLKKFRLKEFYEYIKTLPNVD